MRLGFKGLDNIARRIDKVYVGVNNIARKCVKGYVGVNGVATLIYPVDQAIPTVEGHYTYDRTLHEAEISHYDPDMVEVVGTTKTSQAGTHTITFKLRSTLYRWEDGTNTPKSFTWVIDKAQVAIPTITAPDNTYNGAIHSATISQYDPYAISVGGEVSAINAGTHVVTFNLTSTTNYSWNDGTTEQKTASWLINPAKVAVPTVSGSYTYNGKEQSAVISDYDKNAVTYTGTTKATKAGSYTITYSLVNTNNYQWMDGSTTPQNRTWAIAKQALAVPTVTSNLVYKGSEQSVTFSKYDTNLISLSGTTKGTAAKTNYAAVFTIIDFTNYKWNNSTSQKQTVYWAIAKKSLPIPGVTSNLTYNGSTQKPSITNASAAEVKQGGQINGVNAGTYTITFNLIDSKNTQWSDGSVTQKNGTWSIGKKGIVVPYLTGTTSFTYDGQNHSVTVKYNNTSDKDFINVSGTLSAKNAGTYTVKYNLTSGITNNYQWADGTVTQKTSKWTIAQKPVVIPTLANGDFVYTGSAQSPQLNNYNSSAVKLLNDVTKTDVGNYTITLSLANNNYIWSNGNRDNVSYPWSISINTELSIGIGSNRFGEDILTFINHYRIDHYVPYYINSGPEYDVRSFDYVGEDYYFLYATYNGQMVKGLTFSVSGFEGLYAEYVNTYLDGGFRDLILLSATDSAKKKSRKVARGTEQEVTITFSAESAGFKKKTVKKKIKINYKESSTTYTQRY